MTRRRVMFFCDMRQKYYATPEFNGDKTELEQIQSTDWCDVDWGKIMGLFAVVDSYTDFETANTVAQSFYHSSLGESKPLPLEELNAPCLITADEVIYLNFDEPDLKKVSARELIEVIRTADSNEVVNFSLSSESDINYGASFCRLFDSQVLLMGYWGDTLSEGEAVSMRLFNFSRKDLTEPVYTRVIENYLNEMLEMEGGDGLFLRPERYIMKVGYDDKPETKEN